MDYTKDNKRERCYDFYNKLDKISEVLDMDLYFDPNVRCYVNKKDNMVHLLCKLMRKLDELPDENVQDILIKDRPRFHESDLRLSIRSTTIILHCNRNSHHTIKCGGYILIRFFFLFTASSTFW